MPPPSPITIATSSLLRLIKEEASYHREMEIQQKSIEKLESLRSNDLAAAGAEAEAEADEERGNNEFLLGQERRALEETKAVFPRLRERIEEAKGNLEGLLASAPEGDPDTERAGKAIKDAEATLS